MQIELEERTCKGGCGKKFRVLPTSTTYYARSLCDEICGGKKLTKEKRIKLASKPWASGIVTTTASERSEGTLISAAEKRTASEVAEGKSARFASGRKHKLVLAGDYFSVGQAQDTAVYLGDRPDYKRVLAAFLSEEPYTLSREEVARIAGKSDIQVDPFLRRLGRLLNRNFGGDWLVREGDLYLLSEHIAGTAVSQLHKVENYSYQNYKPKRQRDAELAKKKSDELTEEQFNEIKSLLDAEVAPSRIAVMMGFTVARVYGIRRKILAGEEFKPSKTEKVKKSVEIMRKLYAEGCNDEEVAAGVGLSLSHVRVLKGRYQLKTAKKEPQATKIEIINERVIVGDLHAVFANRPVAARVFAAFAAAPDYTLDTRQLYKALYGKDSSKEDRSGLAAILNRIREKLVKSLPHTQWLVKKGHRKLKDGREALYRLASGPLEVKLFYSQEYMAKMAEKLEAQKTSKEVSGEVFDISSAKKVNVRDKEIEEMTTKAQKYEQAVVEARQHLKTMHQSRMAIAKLCVEVCSIKQGGGDHWENHDKVYTMAKFAGDVGMSNKTLHTWVDAYRMLVSQLPDGAYDETDWSATARAYKAVKRDKVTDRRKIMSIYERERERNGADLHIDKIIKYTRFYTRRIPELPAGELNEVSLVQLQTLLKTLSASVEEKLRLKRESCRTGT